MQASTDLVIALKSEFTGEGAFRVARYLSPGAEKRAAFDALWQIELRTRERLLDYCRENSISIPSNRATQCKGLLLGLLLPLLPWKAFLQNTLQATHYYLEVFRRLERDASREDKALFTFVVDHELAIEAFAKLALSDTPQRAIEPLRALLARS